MYDYISGAIAEISPTQVVIDSGGIGYAINISLQTFTSLSSTESAKIYIHQYLVRDDLPTLYGFFTKGERELFRLLVSVSGVGGGTARMILSTFSSSDLISIISAGNSSMLKTVKGLGAKTSEKVIVELRDKVGQVLIDSQSSVSASESVAVVNSDVYEEAVSALTMLGFSKINSAKVVKNIVGANPQSKVEDVIRLALKQM